MSQKQPNNDLSTSPACLLWFRFDLRLMDHDGVKMALKSGLPVIPIYIYDETLGTRPLGAASKWWLHRSLMALDKDLKMCGSRLIVRKGNATEILETLSEEYNVKRIICSHSFDPKLELQDESLSRRLETKGIKFDRLNTCLLSPPNHVRTKTGDPYRVFTPFYRALVAGGYTERQIEPNQTVNWRPPVKWPETEPISALGLDHTTTASGRNWAESFDIWTPGEAGALKRLAHFIENGLKYYADYRDRTDMEATSKLSAHLRFGEISPHRVLKAIYEAQFHHPSLTVHADKLRSELVWREFSYGLLDQQPKLHQENFKAGFDGIKWRNNTKEFRAWQSGTTGYSLVDAGMRELWQTGIMHNRVRMITASFLIKHLLIDWRWGENWFWDCLVDADPASNPASWQWVAGSGADAAPYFRIFNPITQAETFDPKALYRRKFIPGFQPGSHSQKSKHASAGLFDEVETDLNTHPIVDHTFARERALEAFDNRHK
ncbi:cryptochrome/photolyase family protein [Asticcacaulis endophyticus]|nr:deoxyribodipyrimidine photo-lyase [Asticcacaulis endophyticus]